MENQNTINEIREKVNIVDLISEYLPLTKKGQYYWGLCPFHNDKNPSMSVDPKRQTYNCWSCHNSGNVFTFLSEIENVDFKEALRILGNKVGISVSNASTFESKYYKYYEIYDVVNKFYQLLLNTDEGKEARDYLESRKIDKETIKEFQIGLSLSEKNRLFNFLKEKKYDLNTLNVLGLINESNDTFIDRIIFPLDDRNGKIVAFSGRIYKDSKMSKYMNTKETPIFKKGNCLYHYNASKEHVREKKHVVLMEGFMDVIRAYTIGVKNTVALMGTAMSSEQVSLLKKLSNNIYLCLDGDNPGVEATLHNGNLLEEAGLLVKVVLINEDDPDTFILKYGSEKFLNAIENAISFSDYKINFYKKDIDFSSDLEVANYVREVLRETSKLSDDLRIEIILKKLAIETNLSYNTLEKKLKEMTNKKVPKEEIVQTKTKKRDKDRLAALEFIAFMLKDARALKLYDQEKPFFADSDLRSLASEINYYYHNYGNIKEADFFTYLYDKKELLAVYNEVLNLNIETDVNEDILIEYISVINDYSMRLEIKSLEDKMKKEVDDLKKIEIAERIRILRIGEKKDV